MGAGCRDLGHVGTVAHGPNSSEPSKWGVQTLWLVLGSECIYFACFHRVDSGRMLLSMTMMMIMCVCVHLASLVA